LHIKTTFRLYEKKSNWQIEGKKTLTARTDMPQYVLIR